MEHDPTGRDGENRPSMTPICDFVRAYAASGALRLHMPGHKGQELLGAEPWDITEIPGADSLYEADGIIAQSECHASRLFGSGKTLYSTEGSSQCIRAMLFLSRLYARTTGQKPLILAARNVHKTFVTAVSLLGLDVAWIAPPRESSYLSCPLPPSDELERLVRRLHPTALYLTSPDYLGHMSDIARASAVCRKTGTLLLVDNAHGAYLKFLPVSRHPLDLGADICCDSAHKTLPALTGAAYLHLSPHAPALLADRARDAMAVFGSTSPSYLILQSLDAVNRLLAGDFPARLRDFCVQATEERQRLTDRGLCFIGDEPLKWTLDARRIGYTGTELAAYLGQNGVVPEFADPDYVVLMLSPFGEADTLSRLSGILSSLPLRPSLPAWLSPEAGLPERVLPLCEACFADSETVPAEQAVGRIMADMHLPCPPAVPVVVPGERIDRRAVELFRRYGMTTCRVLRDTKHG